MGSGEGGVWDDCGADSWEIVGMKGLEGNVTGRERRAYGGARLLAV